MKSKRFKLFFVAVLSVFMIAQSSIFVFAETLEASTEETNGTYIESVNITIDTIEFTDDDINGVGGHTGPDATPENGAHYQLAQGAALTTGGFYHFFIQPDEGYYVDKNTVVSVNGNVAEFDFRTGYIDEYGNLDPYIVPEARKISIKTLIDAGVVGPKNGLLRDSDGKIRLYKNDAVRTDYNGLYKHTNGKYYHIKSGVATSYNGLFKNSKGKYVVIKGGIWAQDYTGLYKSPATGKTLYIKNGYLDTTKIGLVQNSKGNYLYIKNGNWDDKYNGLYKNQAGKYAVIKNGVWQKSYSGLYISPSTGTMVYVKNGLVDTTKTGLVKNSKGNYVYIKGGYFQSKHEGLIKNSSGKYVLVKNGYWQKNYTGKWTSPSTGKVYNIVNGVKQ